MSRHPNRLYLPTEDVTALDLGPMRWREGRHRHRPAGETIDPSRYGIDLLEEAGAKAFVSRHHYLGRYPAARRAFGLYRTRQSASTYVRLAAELVGVCVLAVPVQPAAGRLLAPDLEPSRVVDLSRLVLLDEVPGNAESWFVRRVLNALTDTLPDVGLVMAYSDPVIRRTWEGEARLIGHVGCVYKALGMAYTGRGGRETVWLLPDGTGLSRRTRSKIRNQEPGCRAGYEYMLTLGAPPRARGEEWPAWLDRALDEGPFRPLRHPGNHRYGIRLDGLPVLERAVQGAPRRQDPIVRELIHSGLQLADLGANASPRRRAG